MEKHLKKLFLFTFIFIYGVNCLKAQTATVTGTVTSVQNEPLIGVTIMVKTGNAPSSTGTTTDFDGKFSINVPQKASLVFSYIGYKTKTIEVGNKTELNITLDDDVNILDEVVAIGYGTIKKSDLTGAVSSVKASELANTASAGIEAALQGKVAGVSVSRKSGKPGETADVKIRGVGSFTASGPLWIIDGVQQNPGAEFNMNDAESIEILKDASAAAIYGAAAANGVVLVTTKRGKKGEAKMSFNAYVGFNNPINLPKMLSTRQFKELRIEDFNGQGRMTEQEMLNYQFSDSQAAYALDFDLTNADYNWRDRIFSQGITQNYDLSFSKGGDDYNYYASFNHYNEKGTYIDTEFKRYSLRLNSDVKVNKWLSFGESMQITYTKDNPNSNADYLNNYMRTVPFMMPYDATNQPGGFGYFPKTNQDGSPIINPVTGKEGDIKSMLGYDGSNLLADEESYRTKNDKYNITGNVFVKIQPIKQLSVVATLGAGFGSGSTHIEKAAYKYHEQKKQSAYVTQNVDRGYGLTGNVVATYSEKFKDHSVTFMLGTETSRGGGRGVRSYATNMLGGIYQVSLADPSFRIVNDHYSNNVTLSYFGRLNYGYKDKYLFTAVMRRDASDRFSKKHRWGTFPSFSGAWRISDENFIKENKNLDWLSSLKLRASWGILGNSGIPQFLYTSNYITPEANYAFGPGVDQKSVTGIRLDYLPNDEIKWEEISTTDIGLDVAMLNNRLTFSFDWYIKNTKDALLSSSIPDMVGMGKSTGDTPGYMVNVGKIRNVGCDFEIGWRDQINKDFNYSVSANIGYFKNKVIETYGDNEQVVGGNVLKNSAKISYTMKGLPIGTFFAYKTDGVFQTQEEVDQYNQMAQEKGWDHYQKSGTAPGDLRFKDVNNDGHIDAKDITKVGDPWPDFTYGFNINMNYKMFDLGLFFQGIQGNDVFNDFRSKTHVFFSDYNTTNYALDRWTGPGSTNKNFRLANGDPNVNKGTASTWFIEDGSYLRLKNIQLGFTMPKRWLEKTFISKCRFYVSGQNLLTFTKYEGFDPEFVSRDITSSGIDYGTYPQSKSFICGVQVDF
ncbi:TonB-dependent receptor [Dysgonomonas sp. 520]|uniref:SusC/RagA family TonB-linked outer membrane protein n=1 Tax=Dysgonomonas sp. 520 TaxID=2302931 RepID=UPI0013D30FD8|nr:TonB-dependent receptor [Dysgonomonas sp. 520]NDW08548.1 TonB-dependent receptor [Dysgonomonas sp. 520]